MGQVQPRALCFLLLGEALNHKNKRVFDSLGKYLYPDANRKERKKKMRLLGLTLALGVMASCLFGLTLWFFGRSSPVPSHALPPGVEETLPSPR